jgi:hypothetical protein
MHFFQAACTEDSEQKLRAGVCNSVSSITLGRPIFFLGPAARLRLMFTETPWKNFSCFGQEKTEATATDVAILRSW